MIAVALCGAVFTPDLPSIDREPIEAVAQEIEFAGSGSDSSGGGGAKHRMQTGSVCYYAETFEVGFPSGVKIVFKRGTRTVCKKGDGSCTPEQETVCA